MVPIDYKEVDIFEEVEVNEDNNFMLFTILRVKEDSLPKGLYKYDVRHSDEDMFDPATIEKKVIVNHMGVLITDKELVFPNSNDPYIPIDKFEYTGFSVKPESVEEYFKQRKELYCNV